MICALLIAAQSLAPAKEIALIIGEPWKDMQARSTAEIGAVYEGRYWYRQPEQLSYLRFADTTHGFKTPTAKFFTIGFDDKGNIDGVRMSPQVEPLPLQEALDVILNLQDQWQKSGWIVTDPKETPAHENNAEWKAQIQDCQSPVSFWHVPDKYQVMVAISCYADERHPGEKRFLINFSMGTPWYEPWKYHFPLNSNIPAL